MKYATAAITCVIKNTDNKYLLVKRYDPNDPRFHGKWQIPSGVVKFGETLEECVRREMKEELNFIPEEIVQMSKVFDSIRDDFHGVVVPFFYRYKNERIKLDPNEAVEYGWYNYAEAMQLDYILQTKLILDEAEKIR